MCSRSTAPSTARSEAVSLRRRGGRSADDETDRPDPDALLRRCRPRRARERARAEDLLRRRAGRRQDLRDARRSRRELQARRQSTSSSAVVETHGRARPRRCSRPRGPAAARDRATAARTLEEFDLDAALARKPGVLLLVDELAHTNAPGSRHAKRWQDVLELLDAGIDVHTTLNVQHVESLNDVVAQITGVRVRETVPDAIARARRRDRARRPRARGAARAAAEGKVYLPEQAAARRARLLPARQPARAARARAAAHRRARRRRRAGVPRASTASRRPGRPASASWSASARARVGAPDPRGPAHGGGPARAVGRRLRRAARRAAARRARTASASRRTCGSPSRSAPTVVRLVGVRPSPRRCSATRASTTSRASSSASRRTRAGAICCAARCSTSSSAAAATSTST